MRKFDWVMFKFSSVVIHCKNNEETLSFINSATKAGLYFYKGSKDHNGEKWFKFHYDKYPFSEGEECFQGNIISNGWEPNSSMVFEWEKYMSEEPTLKEQYFRTGYVVERKNGAKYIVLREGKSVALSCYDSEGAAHSWKSYEDYDDNLNYIASPGLEAYDIERVYTQAHRGVQRVIWQREEVEEITIEEAENIINRGVTPRSKVKIVL